ncbi:hypothetical protein ANRL3_00398 [Anaerolineae bacterium]|nr:hypothetical protein ANRL3_00398 [Anaerolineae bacterium]
MICPSVEQQWGSCLFEEHIRIIAKNVRAGCIMYVREPCNSG